MVFKYKGINREGKRVSSIIEAKDISEAKSKLKTQGIIYEKLSEVKSKGNFLNLTQTTIPQDLLATFAKELTTYLKSGMTIVTALRLLKEQHKNNKKFFSFLNSILTMIEEGKSLHLALSSQSIYKIPRFFIQSINVAEKSGNLIEILNKMSSFFFAQIRLKKQISTALAYPIFMIIVSIVMVSLMIVFVVPKITSVFVKSGQKLPDLTQFVVDSADFLTKYWLFLLIALFLFVILFKLARKFIPAFDIFLDKLLLMTPLIGRITHNYQMGRFSYILSIMLKSGVSFAEAIRLSNEVISNSSLKSTIDLASQKVVEGNKFSTSIMLVSGYKPRKNFIQALALGEESSEVPAVLENMSELYFEENDDKIKVFLSLIEPIMMLIVGGLIGTIVIAMLLPMQDLLKNMPV